MAVGEEPRHGRRRHRRGRWRSAGRRAASRPTWMRSPRSAAADDSLDHDDPVEEVFEDQVACADLIDPVEERPDRRGGRGARQRHRRRASGARGEDRADRQRQGRSVDPARPRPRRRGRHRRTARRIMTTSSTTSTTSSTVSSSSCRRSPTRTTCRAGSQPAAEEENVLRVKGFVEVGGKPMRLLRPGRRPARQPLLRPRLDGRRRPPQPAGGDRPQGPQPPRDRAHPRRLQPMHLLATTSASLDDLVEPVDLRQTPADIVALSFTDSDLAGLAAAWKAEAGAAAVACGWRRCATCAIRCRSICGSTASRATPRSSWSASSAATTGGAMAATGLPRWPAHAASSWRCCPANAATSD